MRGPVRRSARSLAMKRDRRSARNRRRRAARTTAWNRRCRSTGRKESRPSAAISPPRVSCRILPGSASRSGIDSVACVAARKSQYAAGDRRIEPQALQRGDDAVAAERRAEPRHAGIRVRPPRHVGDHQMQVGKAAIDPVVELLVGRVDIAGLGASSLSRAAACDAASSYVTGVGRLAPVSNATVIWKAFSSCGSRIDSNSASSAVSRCGGGSN